MWLAASRNSGRFEIDDVADEIEDVAALAQEVEQQIDAAFAVPRWTSEMKMLRNRSVGRGAGILSM